MSSAFKQTFNEIEIPEELTQRVRLGVSEAKTELTPETEPAPLPAKMSLRKKAAYTICTAAAAAGLLIGSAFVSPTVQNALANFPFFSSLFKSGPITDLVLDELLNNGYNVKGISQTFDGEKTITIMIDASNKEIKASKAKIKNIASNVLANHGIDAFAIKVKKHHEFKSDYVPTAEEELLDKLQLQIHETLLEKGYSFQSIGLGENPSSKEMEFTIDVYNTEKDTTEMLKTAQQIVAEAGRKEKVRIFSLNIEDIELENKKSVILDTLSEGLLGKAEYKVILFSYKSNPFKIIITTSVNSKDDDAQKVTENIENAIDEFLSSPEMKEYVKDIPFELEIMSENDKKLN